MSCRRPGPWTSAWTRADSDAQERGVNFRDKIVSTSLWFYVYYVCYTLRLRVFNGSEPFRTCLAAGCSRTCLRRRRVSPRLFRLFRSSGFISAVGSSSLNNRPMYAAIPLSLRSLATCAAICSLDMTGPTSTSIASSAFALGCPPWRQIAHHVPRAGFVSNALAVSLGPRPEWLDGALSVLSQAGALSPSGLLEHAKPDVIGADLRRRPGELAPGASRDEAGASFVPSRRRGWTAVDAAPPLGSVPGPPAPAPAPAPPTDADVAYRSPRRRGRWHPRPETPGRAVGP